ncbi:MAG: heat shock protein HspQ [Verrucomicrobiota bacterium]
MVLISVTGFEGGSVDARVFDLGEIVHHKRYNYRGVIVAMDPCCMAGETWYQSNKTQPAKNQPWYHVLVHDSGGLSTYVAQSNLEADASGEPILHPRITTYFSEFKDGRYILNQDAQSGGACSI